MPYQIQSQCAACKKSDSFLIGNWPEHLGVYVCQKCQALVNIPVSDGKCPSCGHAPQLSELYDYSFAVPYLGGSFPGQLEPGPICPKCHQKPLTFMNTAHLNMGMVVWDPQKARNTWGRQYLEKAIFINSTVPVIKEFQLDAAKLFTYFNLDAPTPPFITSRMSFPMILDIRTHVFTAVLDRNPSALGSSLSPEELTAKFIGRAKAQQRQPVAQPKPQQEHRPQKQKQWWEFWK